MIDREKVLKGLKCCINADGNPLDRNCKECPYAIIDGTCISVIPLMEDALKCLKELWSQVGTMMDLNDKQSEKIARKQVALRLIADIAYDYDGYDSVEGLKSIIDEMKEIAIKGVQSLEG